MCYDWLSLGSVVYYEKQGKDEAEKIKTADVIGVYSRFCKYCLSQKVFH